MTPNGCCGQSGRRRPRRDPPAPLPENPLPPEGVNLIYLGSGRRTVTGAKSGLLYTLADHRRHFKAHPDDVPALLKSPDFILQP